LVEQPIRNRQVSGSSPLVGSNIHAAKRNFGRFSLSQDCHREPSRFRLDRSGDQRLQLAHGLFSLLILVQLDVVPSGRRAVRMAQNQGCNLRVNPNVEENCGKPPAPRVPALPSA
jgi:hypothetical protein